MSLNVSEAANVFVPEDALLRSFVGVHGTVPLTDVDGADPDEDAVWDALQSHVTVTTDDGEVSNYRVIENGDADPDAGVTVEWQAALSFPHTRRWSVDRVEDEARDRVEVPAGEIRGASYGYSRPAYEYPTDDWQQVDVSEADAVSEQWLHESLLVILGLLEVELDDGSPAYAIAQLAPPVPSPYDVGWYLAYSDRDVAEMDLRRYLLSISGAVSEGVDDPVAAARDRYEFAGTEIDGPDITQSQLQASRGDLETTQMKSLPNRPLTDDEVDTLAESLTQIHGDCTLLLPEEPRYVDDIIRRAQHVTDGEHVSFTITHPDGFTIFELEEREKGLRWFRKQGELTVPTQ